jgi:hypothetical protein
MDKLVKLVAEKADVPEEKARKAVEVVISYLKENLPDPIAGQVDNLLEGGEIPKGLGDTAKGLLG